MDAIDPKKTEWTRPTEFIWEIPPVGGMRVPGRIYATEELIEDIREDQAAAQVANVATMPGIVSYSLAMPDIHWGYGFPIGGVAAFDLEEGVVSPGGVGYDINCGVRLMRTGLEKGALEGSLEDLAGRLFSEVPSGVGSRSKRITLSRDEMERVMTEGARWAAEEGHGAPDDLAHVEEGGRMADADPGKVSSKAVKRGSKQIGTLGSGNHFVEVGWVAEVYDEDAAEALGLAPGTVTAIIHTGSRGFGHQICTDYVDSFQRAVKEHGIDLPDRQLVCAPIPSDEGQAYLGAMRCAINWAFANRQVIAGRVGQAFRDALGVPAEELDLRTIYEVAHNIAKIEEHEVDGEMRELCVHRKGATRAYAPHHRDTPETYRDVGQPVLIPGDMGRYSYVLVGTDRAMKETFGSSCHGAGRQMSRRQAKKIAKGRDISDELAERGIVVRGASRSTIDEEISEAYKDVTNVVDAVEKAGISRKVAQLRPLAVVKG